METVKLSTGIKSLIALWSFSECGLGGLMHALKLPFTGILVGSIAVISIALIARFSKFDKATLLTALSIVLLVKVMVSPHSPWAAYVAVTFQGVMGLILLNSKKTFNISVFIFAVVCLLESALQRILILFLVYGNKFISAIDQAALQLANQLGIEGSFSVVNVSFLIYVLIHLLIGILIGSQLPNFIQNLRNTKINTSKLQEFGMNTLRSNNSYGWVIMFSVSLLVLTLTTALLNLYVTKEYQVNIGWLLLRVLIISITFVYVITPFIKYIVVKFAGTKNQDFYLEEVKVEMIKTRVNVLNSWNLSKASKNIFIRVRDFLRYLFYLTLIEEFNHNNPELK